MPIAAHLSHWACPLLHICPTEHAHCCTFVPLTRPIAAHLSHWACPLLHICPTELMYSSKRHNYARLAKCVAMGQICTSLYQILKRLGWYLCTCLLSTILEALLGCVLSQWDSNSQLEREGEAEISIGRGWEGEDEREGEAEISIGRGWEGGGGWDTNRERREGKGISPSNQAILTLSYIIWHLFIQQNPLQWPSLYIELSTWLMNTPSHSPS